MSDLSVFDVQDALHYFQGLGHDVTTDSRAVHVDGSPYRMPIAHELYLNSDGDIKSLSSVIRQSESPVISHLKTFKQRGLHPSRTLRAMHPHLVQRENSDKKPSSIYRHLDNYDLYDMGFKATRQSLREHTNAPGEHFESYDAEHGWVPQGILAHNDMREALDAHASEDITHQGVKLILGQQSDKLLRLPNNELRDFDTESAVSKLTSVPYLAPKEYPTTGGILVSHDPLKNGPRHRYIYHPETEQLLRFGGN